MNKRLIKLLILFQIILISACDYRCIPAQSYGTSSTISVQLYANPFYAGNLRQNVYDYCKPDCGNCPGEPLDGKELWLNLATEFNPKFNYNFGVSGEVAFCTVESKNIIEGELERNMVANLYTNKINYANTNSDAGLQFYVENQELTRWLDISGKNNHALREGPAPSDAKCRNNVLLESSSAISRFYPQQLIFKPACNSAYDDDSTDHIVKLRKKNYSDLTDYANHCELNDPRFRMSKMGALQFEFREKNPYEYSSIYADFNNTWEADADDDELYFNEEKIKIPYGCMATVYLDKNYSPEAPFEETQILKYSGSSEYKEYNLNNLKVFKDQCTEIPTGWVDNDWGRRFLVHGENWVLKIDAETAAADEDIKAYELGHFHPTGRMNDKQDFVKVPPGCRVDVWGGSSSGTDNRRLTIYHSSTHIPLKIREEYKRYVDNGGDPFNYEYDGTNLKYKPYYFMDYYEVDNSNRYYQSSDPGYKGYAGFYLNGPSDKHRTRYATKMYISHSSTDYRWQTRIMSAKIEDDPSPPPGFDNTTSIPKIKLTAIQGSAAMYFDGGANGTEIDYYDFNKFGYLMKKAEFSIVFVISPNTQGTVLSANDDNWGVVGRIYIEGNKLKFYYDNTQNDISDGITHELADINNSLANIITIQKKQVYDAATGEVIYQLNTRINSNSVANNIITTREAESYNTGIIGGVFELQNSGVKIVNGLTGSIGHMIFFNDFIDHDLIYEVETNLLKDWGLGSCPMDPFLKQLRLKIGGHSSNEEIFNDAGEFIMPESYKTLPKGGVMMIRYEEPPTMTSQFLENCPNSSEIKSKASDNRGHISVSMTIDKGANFVSNIYKFFVEPIERYIKGGTTKDGKSFTGIERKFFDTLSNPNKSIIPNIIKLSLTFYIIFTAMGYLLGLAKYSNWDLISRLVKAGIIISITSNWGFFNTYLVMFFRDGALDIGNKIIGVTQNIGLVTSLESDSKISNIFRGLDEILSLFTSSDVNAKIWSLLFHPPLTGAIMVLLFYISFYVFIEVIARILIIYVSVFIMISFAFIIAPIFLVFSLFKQTQSLFSKWLDLIIGYAIQYIMLATAVGFFASVIKGMFINLIGFAVCWKPILYCCNNTTFTIPLLEWYKPTIFDYNRFNINIKSQYIPNIWDIALLLLVIYFFKKFLNFIIDLAAKIANGVSVSNLADSISNNLGTSDMIGAVKSTARRIDSTLRVTGEAASVASRLVATAMPADRAEMLGKAAGNATDKLYELKDAAKKSIRDKNGIPIGEDDSTSNIGVSSDGSISSSDSQSSAGKKPKNRPGRKVENFITKKLKGGFKNPYESLKKSAYSNTAGRLNRAITGKKDVSEKILVNKIRQEISSGIEQAVVTGGDKEQHVKESVKRMLQKRGISDRKIERILNSPQLERDIKNHRLQTKDAKEILSKNMNQAYNEALKEGGSEEEAREYALEKGDKIKRNIGSMIIKEEIKPDTKKSIIYEDDYKIVKKYKKSVNQIKEPLDGARHKFNKMFNQATRQSSERRLKNMSIMAARLDKDFKGKKKYEDDDKIFIERKFDEAKLSLKERGKDIKEIAKRTPLVERTEEERKQEEKFKRKFNTNEFMEKLKDDAKNKDQISKARKNQGSTRRTDDEED